MSKRRKKVKPRTKEFIADTTDIVINTESDEDALMLLKKTLTDDYPDLDLGKMDLHEAVKTLNDERGNEGSISKLNNSLGDFLEKQGELLNKIKDEQVKRKRKKK